MRRALLSFLLLGALTGAAPAAPAKDTFQVTARRRREVVPGTFEVQEKSVRWRGRQTALVVVDMWDRHWCRSAEQRAAAMVPRMNAVLAAVRARGGLVVHAPSDTTAGFYAETPQRALATAAPPAKPAPRGGDKWIHLDPKVEAPLPIDDSDGGCACDPPCKPPKGGPYPWTRQNPDIQVQAGDAVSENGREMYNLFRQRGIKHVLFVGVHTNMCVLGRSFGIRQMARWGFDVALVRDLTDVMYNPARPPMVSSDKAVELVVEHVERYWAPSIDSGQLLGEKKRPRIVFAIAEDEYRAKTTLPAFATEELEQALGAELVFLHGQGKRSLPGIESVDAADLLVLYLRRMTLPDADMARIRRHLQAGKPMVALRTSSHAFQNWLEFDTAVLGAKYSGHERKGVLTQVRPAEGAARHPVLAGVRAFESPSWLYRAEAPAASLTPLLLGKTPEREAIVAWTNVHRGGRIFYTSLGHPDDFRLPAFRHLLRNAVHWALDRPVPAHARPVPRPKKAGS